LSSTTPYNARRIFEQFRATPSLGCHIQGYVFDLYRNFHLVGAQLSGFLGSHFSRLVRPFVDWAMGRSCDRADSREGRCMKSLRRTIHSITSIVFYLIVDLSIILKSVSVFAQPHTFLLAREVSQICNPTLDITSLDRFRSRAGDPAHCCH
jgi:hypothetical protein